MGMVKAWYQEILEREQAPEDAGGRYVAEVINNIESRQPLLVSEINRMAVVAAEMDKSDLDLRSL